jgi:hypothetical protein
VNEWHPGFVSVPMLDGAAGIRQAVAKMQAFVELGLHDPRVRRVAEWILRGVPGGDRCGEARRFFDFILAHVEYRRDPAWMEQIKDPRLILAQIEAFGWSAEDCDGHATLAALLGFQVRLPMCLVLASETKVDPLHDADAHVYAAMWEAPGAVASDAWLNGNDDAPSGLVSLDTARPGAEFGRHAPGFYRRVVPAVK